MIGEVCGFDGVIYSRWENLNLGRICFVVEDDIQNLVYFIYRMLNERVFIWFVLLRFCLMKRK